MRVKAVVAYDGSIYHGFQKQKTTTMTVASAIEDALNDLHIYSPVVGSGRTDAGVHATGQVIHFDVPDFWNDPERLRCTLNRKLSTIYFKHISLVPEDFHARFAAKKRLYRYVFKTHKPSIFEQKYISYYETFDPKRLKYALSLFEGTHDFMFFHKTGTATHTTIREIYRATYKERNGYHFIYFQANGFLRSQVRMMVDMVMSCAKNETSLTQLQEQLECQKKHSSRLAPAEGLYLAKILY